MKAQDVVDFWEAAQALALEVCIDGGWAVDACLGAQTRPHNDLDIALPAARVPRLRAHLEGQGFREVAQPDSWAHNFVLEHPDGRIIDVHSYILDTDGGSAGGVPYEAQHLTGEGRILGTTVRCVPPEWLVRFHAGYEIDADDWHDVRLLCERFNIPIPDIYEPFLTSG